MPPFPATSISPEIGECSFKKSPNNFASRWARSELIDSVVFELIRKVPFLSISLLGYGISFILGNFVWLKQGQIKILTRMIILEIVFFIGQVLPIGLFNMVFAIMFKLTVIAHEIKI